jgi:hypothetical protein
MRASAEFKPTKWEEKLYEKPSNTTKLAKGTVQFAFKGEIEGAAREDFLFFYGYFDETDRHKANSNYVGLIRFEGTVNGKAGSFVMEDKGAFTNGEAKSELQILAGSGTKELTGIIGKGHYRSSQTGSHLELDYNLPIQ